MAEDGSDTVYNCQVWSNCGDDAVDRVGTDVDGGASGVERTMCLWVCAVQIASKANNSTPSLLPISIDLLSRWACISPDIFFGKLGSRAESQDTLIYTAATPPCSVPLSTSSLTPS